MNAYRSPRIVGPLPPEDVAGSAQMRMPQVVHSSCGRLRVHLPHWSGTRGEDIVAGVCRLRGVTSAEANPLTGNVLILFEPQQTCVQTLLESLPTLRLEPPALLEEIGWHTVVPQRSLVLNQNGSAVYMTGTGRLVYKTLGWSSVGMAVVGAITPGIPTAPFVILGGYFFIRSSPQAHEWLRHSRWFGPILRDWEGHRGVRRSVKNAAVGLIGGSMGLTALMPLATPLKVTIVALQVVGLAIVLRLRVVEPVSLAPADAIQGSPT